MRSVDIVRRGSNLANFFRCRGGSEVRGLMRLTGWDLAHLCGSRRCTIDLILSFC